MPESNLVTVPAHVSLNSAALAEPIACGWHAVRLGRRALGDGAETAKVLVLGGGAIGLGAALSCAAQGMGNVTIIEPNESRRRFLVGRCGQKAIAPETLSSDEEFELIIDGVGFDTTRAQASARVRPGGVIMHIGLGSATGGLDIRRMTLQEISFIGTYTYTARDFRETSQAIFDGRLGDLDWIEQRPLAQGSAAFSDIRTGKIPCARSPFASNASPGM